MQQVLLLSDNAVHFKSHQNEVGDNSPLVSIRICPRQLHITMNSRIAATASDSAAVEGITPPPQAE
jgi:hypothetical protein